MSGHGSKFGRKKEAAVAALLTARNEEEAARSIGVGPATLRRWQKDPEFDSAYRGALRVAHRQTVGRLQQASRAAVSTLMKLMVDVKVPASTRARCADSILNRTTKA